MIELTCLDGIATVTIRRAEKANCLSQADKRDVAASIDQAAKDDSVLAVIVTGQGTRAFCAGSDISEMGGFSAPEMYEMLGTETSMYQSVLKCPKPVIGCINGAAMGAGLILAMSTDYTVVSASAKLGAPELAIGVSAPLEGLLLPWLVGLARARRMFYMAEHVPATDALEMGLVNEVVSPDVCVPRAIEVAKRMAGLPGDGFSVQKALLYRLVSTGDMESVSRESRYMTSFQLANPATTAALQAFANPRSNA